MDRLQHIGVAFALLAIGAALLSRTRAGDFVALTIAVWLAIAIIFYYLEKV